MIGQCLSNKNENATVAKKLQILGTKQGLNKSRLVAALGDGREDRSELRWTILEAKEYFAVAARVED